MPKIEVFRLNHRKNRDARLSTHLCLVARAFGASAIYYSGEKDAQLEKSIKKVVKNWGGSFSIKHVPNARKFIKSYKGKKVNLTMYGLPFKKSLKPIASSRKPVLLIVGGAKVPGYIYQLADFNLSVTSQPHSEVAALAVFLHDFFKAKELGKKFKGRKLQIVPQKKGKKVISGS